MEIGVLAILQARFSSSRLPGKVLKPILGKAMLLHQIERVKHSKKIDRLVVATSTDETDNEIERVCLENGVTVFRGDLDNVLDRFYQCAKYYNPLYIVRLTGDCPLVDWEVIDNSIDLCITGKYDYVATSSDYPDGLDCEVLTMDTLKVAWSMASLPSEKEHVTYYVSQKESQFNIGILPSGQNLSCLRWTVDESEDFYLIEAIYQSLYPEKPDFLTCDILTLLEERPELKKINDHIVRNEGLKISLNKDKQAF